MVTENLHEISNLSSQDCLKSFQSSIDGLTSKEAKARLKRHGKNILVIEKKYNPVSAFLNNFKNPLVLILIMVGLISIFTGEDLDAIFVFAMVFLSIIFNFILEFKANKSSENLKKKIANNSTVRRDSIELNILTTNIVLGDMIVLNAGDLIPADCKIIEANDLFVDQSALTGESLPTEKTIDNDKKEMANTLNLRNILFAGTHIVSGSALALCVKTSVNTQFGSLTTILAKAEDDNDFTKGIKKFSLLILRIVIFFVVLIFFLDAVLKHDIMTSLLFSIAVAVGLTPEFLPMIMSVSMSKGSVDMAQKGVIVKKLTAIPTFGSMQILCADKTGTLTQNLIEVVRYIDVMGENSEEVFKYAYITSSFQTGITNPMDDAVLRLKHEEIKNYKKIEEIPYDFERKKMSVIVMNKRRTRFIITKGAPEEVIKGCTHYLNHGQEISFSKTKTEKILKWYKDFSKEGYRVLAVSYRKMTNKNTYSKFDEQKQILLGYIAFFDPPKKDVGEAIKTLESLGVEIKILTGDNQFVTNNICANVGLNIKGIMLGSEAKSLPDNTLKNKLENITVFAMFSPEDKMRIIKLLKETGKVVGYLGDGINDSPSIMAADVGISVSNAVSVAKSSADLILTKKSMHILCDGIMEGRKAFGNTIKYIMMGISSNFGNMFSVLGAVIFLPFLPMLPIQILLNNFLYDLAQITIPTDNVDEEYIKTPKKWDMHFIRNFMLTFGPISSMFDYLAFFTLFFILKANASYFQTGWFIVSLATQTLVIHLIRTRKIPFFRSKPSKYLIISTIVIVIMGWSLIYSSMGAFFGFTKLPLSTLGIMAIIVIGYLAVVEVGKFVFYYSPWRIGRHSET